MGSDRWIRAALFASMCASFATLGACDSDSKKSSCEEGKTQSCSCDGGATGTQTCEKGALKECICDGSQADAGTSPGKDAGMTPEVAKLKGRVFDADTGRAVDSAELKAKSGEIDKSDGKGNFELPANAEQVAVSKKNYAGTVKEPPQKGGYMEVFIKDVEESVEFDAAEGTKFSLASGGSIDVPPGAVRDAEGKSVSGTVKMAVADVDGSERKQASALPGNLSAEGKNAEGKDAKGNVSVHRAFEITITNAEGKKLTVGKDDKVFADFPDNGADSPNERSGFSFNEKKGMWVEEGKVKRTLNDEGKHVYRKDIDHLSWHGYGDFFSVLTCVHTCVEDGDKKPLAGAQVWMVGASFPGVTTLFTGDDGCAFGAVPVKQSVVLVAQVEAGVSKPTSFVAGNSEQNAVDNPDQCGKPDTLVIGEATAGTCPFGFVECGKVCTDLATDADNCGKCGTECGGSAGREEACTAGECGCAEGKTACGSGATLACTDLKTDYTNCGKCGNDLSLVDGASSCVNGKAVPFSCAGEYDQFCDGVCVDVQHNDANCGGCGSQFACAAGLVCLGSCKDPATDMYLCTSATSQGCGNGSYCYGESFCNPESELANTFSGCVQGPPPCLGVGICDPELMTCDGACLARTFPAAPPPANQQGGAQCSSSAISGCLLANETGKNLGTAIECGAAANATPVDPPPFPYYDEFGSIGDCSDCLRVDLMECASNGDLCTDKVTALYCCSDTWACNDQTCLLEHCQAEFDDLDTCLDTTTCYTDIQSSLCFGG